MQIVAIAKKTKTLETLSYTGKYSYAKCVITKTLSTEATPSSETQLQLIFQQEKFLVKNLT